MEQTHDLDAELHKNNDLNLLKEDEPQSGGNWIDPQLAPEYKTLARGILKMYGLKGLRVRFNSQEKAISFTQDRRVVDVPVVLAQDKKWSDIRFLFRAVLSSAPSSWNLTADDNDWSAYKKG